MNLLIIDEFLPPGFGQQQQQMQQMQQQQGKEAIQQNLRKQLNNKDENMRDSIKYNLFNKSKKC